MRSVHRHLAAAPTLPARSVTDATTASRSLAVGFLGGRTGSQAELLAASAWLDENRQIVANDETIGTTSVFGSRRARRWGRRTSRPRCWAEACLEPAWQMHVRHGRLPAGQYRWHTRAFHRGFTSSVAWRVGGQDTSTASTVRCTRPRVCGQMAVLTGIVSGPKELTRSPRRTTPACCVPALAGPAAPWWKSHATAAISGMTSADRRASTSCLAVLPGHSRTGRRAGSRRSTTTRSR